MFKYKEYQNNNELLKQKNINNEEYNKKRNEINRKYKIILTHILSDSLLVPIKELLIIDDKENNICEYNYKLDKINYYTIDYKEIQKIKLLLENKKLYKNKKIKKPPVLDGTNHELYLTTNNNYINIKGLNLWYYDNKESIQKNINITEDERNYTTEILNTIKKIQLILKNNDININILEEEEI